MKAPLLLLVGRACLLSCGLVTQAVWAEQRASLRAGRAGEAVPIITLPQSLLLQGSDADARSGRGQSLLLQSSEGRSLSEAEVRDEVQASQGSELWNSMQESANDVVKEAREAFFADATTAVATTTAAVTTTTAVTTVDPAILAKQLNISRDAAQARNLLVGMITRAQIGMISRLNDISLDLEATELRAQMDLKAVNHSFNAAKTMPIMASNAEVDVTKIEVNGDNLKAALPQLEERAKNGTTLIAALIAEKADLEKDVGKSAKLPGAKRRVQNNQNTLSAIIPRLEKLERRVGRLELKLYDGDLHKLVDDSTNKEVVNVMEDVSRGFGRFIANKE